MELPKSKPISEIKAMKETRRQGYRDNRQRIINHLKGRDLRNVAIAGIIGNIDIETGGTFDYKQRQTKSGNPRDPNVTPGGAYGLFQFDDPGKKAGHETWYKQYLEKTNKTDSAESQLDYFLDTVNAAADKQNPFYSFSENVGTGNTGTIKGYFQLSEDPKTVSDSITDRFLKPGKPKSDKRRASAEAIFAELQPVDPDNQFIDQPGNIVDTGDDTFPMERVQDIPEEKSMYEAIKPYVPVLRHFNEGGAVPMQKQMEMFEDGGLKDEGGSVDPVSGNDVPPGSTQEEVRDDIPAQLSEGEFVFPADVVRFIGLNNLMQMRQQAKMGLKQMEEMGQMGNSEEATMPDDLPFDINDLDMEDELEYNVGGFVPGTVQQQQYGISGMQQAAAPTTGVAAVPQQAASSQYVQPVQAAVPTAPVYTPAEVPTFKGFVGENVPGVDFEYVEYKNEAGNVIKIRKSKTTGDLLDPVPEGYTFVDPEATKVEEATVAPTTPQTTTVREEGGDGVDQGGAFGNVERMKQRNNLSKSLGFTTMETLLEGVGGTFGTYGKDSIGKRTGTGYIIGEGGQLLDPLTGTLIKGGDTSMSPFSIISGAFDKKYQNQVPFGKDFMNAIPDNLKTKEFYNSIQGQITTLGKTAIENRYNEVIKNIDDPDDIKNAKNIRKEMMDAADKNNVDSSGSIINPFEMPGARGGGSDTGFAGTKGSQQRASESAAENAARDAARDAALSEEGPDRGPEQTGGEDRDSGNSGGNDGYSGRDDFGGAGRYMQKGGLASKPKAKKIKKMKRGGLASKK